MIKLPAGILQFRLAEDRSPAAVGRFCQFEGLIGPAAHQQRLKGTLQPGRLVHLCRKTCGHQCRIRSFADGQHTVYPLFQRRLRLDDNRNHVRHGRLPPGCLFPRKRHINLLRIKGMRPQIPQGLLQRFIKPLRQNQNGQILDTRPGLGGSGCTDCQHIPQIVLYILAALNRNPIALADRAVIFTCYLRHVEEIRIKTQFAV